MIANLTKENFFNGVEFRFPDAMKKFLTWIDQYKIEIGWDRLFQPKPGMSDTIKFHEVPLEFQVGIMGRFFYEMMSHIPGEGKSAYRATASGLEYRDHLFEMFGRVQDDCEKSKIERN